MQKSLKMMILVVLVVPFGALKPRATAPVVIGEWASSAIANKGVVKVENKQGAGIYAKFVLYFNNGKSTEVRLNPNQTQYYVWATVPCIKEIEAEYGKAAGVYGQTASKKGLNFCAKDSNSPNFNKFGVILSGGQITARKE